MLFPKSFSIALLLFFCAAAQGEAAAFPEKPARLDRANLLQYRNAKGDVVEGADWARRRAEVVKGMEEVMGAFPGREKRCLLDLKVEEEADCGSYVLRLVSYATEPGARVPAYLLLPKSALAKKRRHFGILALHPTDMRLGHKVAVGLGGKENRDYGAELAKRGYVVLAPAYPLMANYQPDLKALGYASGTMKAIWDNVRGLDLLESLPGVKEGRFGVIGHSLGGHNAIYTAVFEPRIKVVVSSCGFDSFLDYMDGNIKGWTQERYMPRLANFAGALEQIPFDFHELLGALAPRAVFVNAPKGDSNFKWQSVDKIVRAARPVFRLYGVEKNLQVRHPDCGHDFPAEMREQAYQLFSEQLK